MPTLRALLLVLFLLVFAAPTLSARPGPVEKGARPSRASLRRTSDRVAELGGDIDWLGPVLPPWVAVTPRFTPPPDWTVYVIPGVPAYEWRHGCTPTAIGMIMGYYDGLEYEGLIPGDASTQTEDVNQAIASQRSELDPGNYEDYCLPIDSHGGPIEPDRSELPEGDEHTDDSIADFLWTSQSVHDLGYGWTRTTYLPDNLPAYITYRRPDLDPAAEFVYFTDQSLNWEFFKAEMEAGRPMQMSVDTDGDDASDHSIATIGYAESADSDSFYYGCLDTWGPAEQIRWSEFEQMAPGQLFGIRRGTCITMDRSLIVDASGAGDYTTIQDAIDAAPDDRIIKVMPGTYSGNGNLDIDPGNRGLHLLAMTSRGDVIIDCENAGHAFYFNSSQDSTTVVEGFTIRNGLASYGGAIECFWTCSPKLVDLTIESCQATTGGGAIACRANSNPIIRNCSIRACEIDGNGGGIFCGASSPVISGTTIAECQTSGTGAGIYCFSTSSPVITNTIIANSVAGSGMAWDVQAGATVTHSCIYGNAGGDAVPAGGDNLFVDPLFCPGALTLYDDSPCLPANNVWGERVGAYGAGGCGTPVSGILYAVATASNEVTLRWDLDSLDDVEGLIVRRSLDEQGPFVRLNSEMLVPTSPGVFVDRTVWPETTFWYQLSALLPDGTEDIAGQGIVHARTTGTLGLRLANARPTPFTDRATFSLEIPHGSERTDLTVFDAAGRRVRTLVNGTLPAGRCEIIWDGRDDAGRAVSAGVYFVRLVSAGTSLTAKAVLVR